MPYDPASCAEAVKYDRLPVMLYHMILECYLKKTAPTRSRLLTRKSPVYSEVV